MTTETAICAGCLTRVDACELDNEDRKCDLCREHKARAGAISEPEDSLAQGPAAIELFDDRALDGGVSLHDCDEV
jgi:hypothetical protein